jgi:hypothetical protein
MEDFGISIPNIKCHIKRCKLVLDLVLTGCRIHCLPIENSWPMES